MNLTNIYDFSFDDNSLTNHEYVCFLQTEKVRKALHVGPLPFNSGFVSYNYLNEVTSFKNGSFNPTNFNCF